VKVTPGLTYVIELTGTEILSYWGTALGNLYPNGRGIQNGFPEEDEDRAFRTYGPSSNLQPVGGVVMPANTFAMVSPWLALVGVVGCIGTVVVLARRRGK
jgi:hypothetical protein